METVVSSICNGLLERNNDMRKTAILAISLTVAIASVLSCNKMDEKRTGIHDGEKSLINAVAMAVGNDTKAHSAICYEALWDENDRIFVTDGKKTDYFSLCAGAGTVKGTFIQELDHKLNPPGKMIAGEVEIFSPASLRFGDHYEWPAIQTADQAVPMYASQNISGTGDETVYFSSLGAMLQIALTASEKDTELAEIRLSDANKPLSGEFVVTDGKAVMTGSSNDGITLQLNNVIIGKTVKSFYIAVPAGKYEDLELDFVFSDGRIRKMRSTTMPEIELNTMAKIALYLDVSHMPTKIQLNHMNLDLEPGVSFQLSATVLPKDATNRVIWKSLDESIATVDQKGNVRGVAVGTTTITATTEDAWLTDFCIVTVDKIPAGALSGKFSVSEGKQVYFSQGNLWLGNWIYDRTMETEYYFEDHQWQHQPLHDSTWVKSHKNHFFWSKFQEITLYELFPDPELHATKEDVIFTNETDTTPRKDFGVVINGKRRVGLWRTLSAEEWKYLLEERPMTYGKPRYTNWWGGVKIEDPIFHGVFIYPDDYNGDEVTARRYTWKEINDAGIAFLPVAGLRERNKITKLPGSPYSIGWYWASDTNKKDDRTACTIYFDGFVIKYSDDTYRGTGISIRLVRDVTE